MQGGSGSVEAMKRMIIRTMLALGLLTTFLSPSTATADVTIQGGVSNRTPYTIVAARLGIPGAFCHVWHERETYRCSRRPVPPRTGTPGGYDADAFAIPSVAYYWVRWGPTSGFIRVRADNWNYTKFNNNQVATCEFRNNRVECTIAAR